MDSTLFLAQLIGTLFTTVGIGMFLNQQYYAKMIMDFSKNSALIYLGGITALVFGFLILSVHQKWGACAEIIVTLVGHVALIKGILMILFPACIANICKCMLKKELIPLYGALALALGVYLLYAGFQHLF